MSRIDPPSSVYLQALDSRLFIMVSIFTTSARTGILGWLLSKMNSCCGKLSLNELKMLRANSTKSISVGIRLETIPFASFKWLMA